ncbi:DUF177 domain-containing protein [Angustibacter luteus]|uniref:DUF177 domain-containing protein n=2 Tax=Angustibacter luteus TaxID=658456 RepID=A0ABW1JJ32_9ACTN
MELAISLDPRAPLVLDVHELGRRPGSMITNSREVPAPAEMGTDVIGFTEGAPLWLDLRLESVMEGVLVTGTVRGSATGECIRCLTDLEQELEVPVTELFAYPGKQPPEDVDEDDVRELEGDLIDFEPVLRDAVVPALPFQPVCRADCPGLCSECGARLADDPNHHHDVVDPRWAALQGLAPTAGEPTDDEEEN